MKFKRRKEGCTLLDYKRGDILKYERHIRKEINTV